MESNEATSSLSVTQCFEKTEADQTGTPWLHFGVAFAANFVFKWKIISDKCQNSNILIKNTCRASSEKEHSVLI